MKTDSFFQERLQSKTQMGLVKLWLKKRENALKHLILKKRSALNAKKNTVLSRRAALNHKNARHNKYIFLFLRKRHYSQHSKSKQVWNKSKKISKSLLKDQIRHNKDNKGGFQAVKMFISTHNSLKTACRCILSLSVTDIMWGRALGVKCRWQTGLM